MALIDAPEMTEEDQLLVARAALAGARFRRKDVGWTDDKHIQSFMYTIGRAAAHVLMDIGEMPEADYRAYLKRTEGATR